MPDDQDRIARPTPDMEEKGILGDVIVPLAASGLGGAAAGATNAVVTNILKRPEGEKPSPKE
jgi:hypothetical protein